MADSVVGVAVYMMPGQSAKLKSPVDSKNRKGYFARVDDLPTGFTVGPNQSALIRGFVAENTDVGNIVPTTEEEAAVVYTHNKPFANAIWFFSRTEEIGLVKIISVPIHDHSTIIHGGPAYGTYFDDDIER
jgi:hypothetical protein